jgi:hypothetical protein
MGRRKSTPNVRPNTLESMIEYTLISNILDKICEMTKNLLEYPRDDTRLNPYAPSPIQWFQYIVVLVLYSWMLAFMMVGPSLSMISFFFHRLK